MINLSYSMTAACFFFPAFLESIPKLSLKCLRPSWTNALMGFSLAWWMQFHRTWLLMLPFILVSFFLQWRQSRKTVAPLFFLLGALPLLVLVVPTLMREDYLLFRDVSGLSLAFNPHNFLSFFKTLSEFLSLSCFQLPRFIGDHTDQRMQFLSSQWLLTPGFFLWYFGILQAVILLLFWFDYKNTRPGWKPIRLFVALAFLLVYISLLFSAKNPDVNTFCEMLPLVMIYSLYIWEKGWALTWARNILWFFLACTLVFQTSFVFNQRSAHLSFYLQYHDAIAKAIDSKDYHVLGERRAGSLY